MHEPTRGRSEQRAEFSTVYAANADRVYGFIGYRVHSAPEAEDLTQLVFEKAFRAWNRFDPSRASESTWLLAIARNVLIDHFRKRRETLLGDESVAEMIDATGEPGSTVVSPDLGAALAGLSPREQTIIALRFGGDLTGREIAEVLDLSTDNVHQIVSRALRRLRAALAESGVAD